MATGDDNSRVQANRATNGTADKLSPSATGPAAIVAQKPAASSIATLAAGANGIQVREQDRQSWFSRWRWVLAALAVIILGRISSS